MKRLHAFLMYVAPFCAQGQHVTVTVSAGDYARYNIPVRVSLPVSFSPTQKLTLVNKATRKKIPAQLLDSVTLIFILNDSLPPHSSRSYDVIPAKAVARPSVTVEDKTNGLLVKSSGKPVFFYHTREALPPADSPSYYKRSGFIHPLYSPAGQVLTDDFPAGHVHQHGIFAAWTNTTFRNELVDFWNQQLLKGTVEHVKTTAIREGRVCAQIRTVLRHNSRQFGKVLEEQWTLTVFPFTDYFLFDLQSQQLNTSSDTLFINKYHYGGFAFRGAHEWNPDDKKFFKNKWSLLTSEGVKDTFANHTHARWVDVCGDVDGRIAGAAVFSHPSNFRYPQAIRVHPSMPYWTYAPMVDGPFYIAPGQEYNSQFRYYIHNDAPDGNLLNQLEQDYAHPPEVKAELRRK